MSALTVGDKFRLIGNHLPFVAKRLYMAAGDIPAVYGETATGSLCTHARVCDVIKLAPEDGTE